MDSKDIEERGKQLAKAATEGDTPETILSLLNGLKGWTASEKLLRQTKIGIHVNKLRQNSDKAVASTATTLVNKWKTDVKKPGHGKSSPAPAQSQLGAKVSTNGTASPAPAATPTPTPTPLKMEEKVKVKYTGDPEKRNATVDGVDYKQSGNATRDNCVKLMYDGLSFLSSEPSEEILVKARAVELAAYNAYQPETSADYKSRIRSLFQNLKNKSNPALRSQVFSGVITAERFVKMTHEELKSDKQRAEDERLQKENMDKSMVPQQELSISASLQCGKCGQKKVSYSQAQTRSADEPMTTFCTCTICGKMWKFS